MIPENVIALDTETTIKNQGPGAVGKQSGNPFSTRNRIVSLGLRWPDGQYAEIYQGKKHPDPGQFTRGTAAALRSAAARTSGEWPMLILHNSKFDLHHLRAAEPAVFQAMQPQLRIWDTQHVEYLLSGQLHSFPALNDLILKYGGTVKDDRIKEYWQAGVDTEDIPPNELLGYMKNDVLMTHFVFTKQYEIAAGLPNMLNLIESQMEFLLSLQEMEWNGMTLNRELAQAKADGLRLEIKQKSLALIRYMKQELAIPEPNFGSTQQLSTLLFGGLQSWVEKEPELDEDGNPKLFKSGMKKGQPRYKNVPKEQEFRGLCPQLAKPRWQSKNGSYSTAEAVLREIAKHPDARDHSGLAFFLDTILEMRGIQKDLSTYYQGYQDLTWPDGQIHQNLNNCKTHTGRLSCTAPNLQNTSHGDD